MSFVDKTTYHAHITLYFCNINALRNGMKFTQATLNKLEDVLGESGYITRYERGTFQSGWCLLEQKKIVVLNKFLDVEGKINILLELIPSLTIDYDKLTLESQKLYEEVLKKHSTSSAAKEEQE